MSERTESDMLSKSVNGSPKSEIILKSNYLAPTRSLSKLSCKNKQETQREPIRVVEPEEKRTQFSLSPFPAPSGEQIYQYAPVIQQQSYNRDSPSSNIIRQPQNLLASSDMIRRNLFPSIPFSLQTRMTMLNLGGTLITSLFLYFMVCLFTISHWKAKLLKRRSAFELGRFHRDMSLLPSPLQLRPTFPVIFGILKHFFVF